MPDTFEPLDAAALARTVGGEGMNVDRTTSRWRAVQIEGIPIPYRVTMTTRDRTPFGACVDRTAAICERTGGDATSMATCKLADIHRCWQDTKTKEAP